RELGFSQAVVDLAQRQREQSLRSLAQARAAGVKVVAGTDAVTLDCTVAVECRLLAEAGDSNAEAIAAATSLAAGILGAADHVGTLQAGRFADFVAVEGDPLADIGALSRVRHVVQGGRMVWSPECAATVASQPRGFITPAQSPVAAH